jgi:hypothetical protein
LPISFPMSARFMQSVGAAWLMTSLSSSPFQIRLIQAASTSWCILHITSLVVNAPAVKSSYVGWSAAGGNKSILLLHKMRVQGVVVSRRKIHKTQIQILSSRDRNYTNDSVPHGAESDGETPRI